VNSITAECIGQGIPATAPAYSGLNMPRRSSGMPQEGFLGRSHTTAIGSDQKGATAQGKGQGSPMAGQEDSVRGKEESRSTGNAPRE
jgi:hypothetical protein